MATALKAKIYKDDATPNKPYVWFYVVDYVTNTGERDIESDSFDYGSVESQEFATECVDDAFARFAGGEC